LLVIYQSKQGPSDDQEQPKIYAGFVVVERSFFILTHLLTAPPSSSSSHNDDRSAASAKRLLLTPHSRLHCSSSNQADKCIMLHALAHFILHLCLHALPVISSTRPTCGRVDGVWNTGSVEFCSYSKCDPNFDGDFAG
jgi:hypothetical protein